MTACQRVLYFLAWSVLLLIVGSFTALASVGIGWFASWLGTLQS